MTEVRERKLPFLITLAIIIFLPFLGKGGLLAAAILAAALVGSPLFVLIGIGTLGSLFLWSGFTHISQFSIIIEAIRSLADSPTLLAIPFFIMSGAVMSKGQISQRLIEFAQAFIGWVPGGMAMSGVLACMLFAAISGSSPATVVAIGTMMGPAPPAGAGTVSGCGTRRDRFCQHPGNLSHRRFGLPAEALRDRCFR